MLCLLAGTHFHRLTLAALVYIIDVMLLIGALVVVKPWLSEKDGGKTKNPAALCAATVAVLVAGSLFFHWLSRKGLSLLLHDRHSSST